MAIPVEVAQNLTFPETVTDFNYDRLTEIVNTNKANFVIRNNGQTRINLKYAMFRKGTELLYDDVIVRDHTAELEEDEKGNIEYPENSVSLCARSAKPNVIVKTGNEKLFEGDRVIRNGKLLEDVKYPSQKKFTLKIGDVVEKHLQDGNIVLLNRQPRKN